MKNQLDLIVISVAVLLALIFSFIMYETKPQVTVPAAPTAPNTGPLQAPPVAVSYANSLPGGGANGGGGGSATLGSFGGAPPSGMGGAPPSGLPPMGGRAGGPGVNVPGQGRAGIGRSGMMMRG